MVNNGTFVLSGQALKPILSLKLRLPPTHNYAIKRDLRAYIIQISHRARRPLILVVGHIRMHGRTLFKIGLLFPLLVVVLFSVAEIFFRPGGPEASHFVFPPFLFGYVLFAILSWKMINRYVNYNQGRNYLLIAPFMVCILMLLSQLLYHTILFGQKIDDMYESLTGYIIVYSVAGFLYIAAFSVILGLLYILGLAREYVPNYAIKGTSV